MVALNRLRTWAVPLAVATVAVWGVAQETPIFPPTSAPATNAASSAVAPSGLALPAIEPVDPQAGPPLQVAPRLSPEELSQLLAPVALYPDALLSQVLMASTYPLEVVQARRWVENHPNLQGEALAAELAKEPWEPSVKSLVATPSVLQLMDDKLDWTIRLGDAFLAQQPDVMDTVQRLRTQAQAAGALQNSEQQKITTVPAAPPPTATYPEAATAPPVPQYIYIENPNPQVVYVPVYDPGVVYGTWTYTDHRPFFWRPRSYIPTRSYIWYDEPRPYGPAWSYAWGRVDWRTRQLQVDASRAQFYHGQLDRDPVVRRIRERDDRFRDGRSDEWRHDSSHRQGVAYRDAATARRYTGRDDVRPIVGARRAGDVRSEADRTRDDRDTTRRPVIPGVGPAMTGQALPGANPPNNPGRLPPTATERTRDRTADRDGRTPDRAESERARPSAERPPADRSAVDRAASDRTQSERTAADRTRADRTPTERNQNNATPDPDNQNGRPQPGRPSERTTTERQQADRQQAERQQTERQQAERQTSERPRGEQPTPPPDRTPRGAPATPDRPERVAPSPRPVPAPQAEPRPAPRPAPAQPAPAPAPAPPPSRGSAPERPPERPSSPPAPSPPQRAAPERSPERAAPERSAPAREAAPDRGSRSGGDNGGSSGEGRRSGRRAS